MKRSLSLFAALLCLGLATPALAWDIFLNDRNDGGGGELDYHINYNANGLITAIDPQSNRIQVKYNTNATTDYMQQTMAQQVHTDRFRLSNPDDLTGLQVGDKLFFTFQKQGRQYIIKSLFKQP